MLLGLGIATLLIGLTVRIAISMLAVTGAKLNLKEKIFVAIAWLPKATVQVRYTISYLIRFSLIKEYVHGENLYKVS